MSRIIDLSDALKLGTDGSAFAINVMKDSRALAASPAMAALNLVSYWLVNGAPGGAAAAPGAVAVPVRTTSGGLKQPLLADGKQRWLVSASLCVTSLGAVLNVYDRLLHISGLSGTVATPQVVGGALTRYTGSASVGNAIFAEIYTAVGATPTTIVADYTDQDGNAAVTKAVAFGGSPNLEAFSMIELPLADGDTGVRAVASVTLAGSTGTAGDFGITVAHSIAKIAGPPTGTTANQGGEGVVRNFMAEPPGPVEVQADACLAMMMQTSGTVIPEFAVILSFEDK